MRPATLQQWTKEARNSLKLTNCASGNAPHLIKSLHKLK